MKLPRKLSAAALLLMVTVSGPLAFASKDGLSPAEERAIHRAIAKLPPPDANVAEQWSDAKKVAEVICRPAALRILEPRVAGADRVFLGTDDPESLELIGDSRLRGSGQVRGTDGWREFEFTCEVEPDSAKVRRFDAKLGPR